MKSGIVCTWNGMEVSYNGMRNRKSGHKNNRLQEDQTNSSFMNLKSPTGTRPRTGSRITPDDGRTVVFAFHQSKFFPTEKYKKN